MIICTYKGVFKCKNCTFALHMGAKKMIKAVMGVEQTAKITTVYI
jgi:hypothetical protein